MKDDQRNYIVVGIFVIAMLAGLIAWIALLSGRTGATDDYYILYDNVGGLAEGTQILYQGYPVGMIEEISLVEVDGRQCFRVDVSVKRGWEIPEDSVAEVTASGLLSAVVVEIHSGESETPLEPGSRIGSVEPANVFAVMSTVIAELGDLARNSVKPLIDSIAAGTPDILDQVGAFTTELNATLDRIKAVLNPENTRRMQQILLNLETTSNNVADASGGLRRTQTRLDEVLVTVGELLDEDEGEVGLALVDLQHSLESVARHIEAINDNLEATMRNMNEFSRQIRENPGLIIRGRSAGEEVTGAN